MTTNEWALCASLIDILDADNHLVQANGYAPTNERTNKRTNEQGVPHVRVVRVVRDVRDVRGCSVLWVVWVEWVVWVIGRALGWVVAAECSALSVR